MCMKNLKLTVVIVLVCLVSRNVMFHINYSIRVLLLVWFIVHWLFLFWQKALISKQQLLLTILGNDDAQTQCLFVSVCFQVILYIIVSAACGGLNWPSCVHQWNKIEDEREGEEEEDLKKRRVKTLFNSACQWIQQEARLSFCYSSIFRIPGRLMLLLLLLLPRSSFLLWQCEHWFAFWIGSTNPITAPMASGLVVETDVEY